MTHLRHVLMAALLLASLRARRRRTRPRRRRRTPRRGSPRPPMHSSPHPPQPYPAPHGASGPYPRYDGRYSHNQYYPDARFHRSDRCRVSRC